MGWGDRQGFTPPGCGPREGDVGAGVLAVPRPGQASEVLVLTCDVGVVGVVSSPGQIPAALYRYFDRQEADARATAAANPGEGWSTYRDAVIVVDADRWSIDATCVEEPEHGPSMWQAGDIERFTVDG